MVFIIVFDIAVSVFRYMGDAKEWYIGDVKGW